MAEILSYGEDALTYWVLTHRLNELLSQLGDRSPSNHARAIYRPSFGRGGAAKARGSARAEFGEFDAILRTNDYVYLVEAKWSRSSERTANQLQMRSQQVLRHQIFRWYLDRWRAGGFADWSEFRENHLDQFSDRFQGFAVAPAGSLLANNLEFVLRQISTGPATIRDILLHIGLPGAPKPEGVRPVDFELVHIEAEAISPGGYVRLQ